MMEDRRMGFVSSVSVVRGRRERVWCLSDRKGRRRDVRVRSSLKDPEVEDVVVERWIKEGKVEVDEKVGVGELRKEEEVSVEKEGGSVWGYIWPRTILLFVAAVWGTNFGVVKLLDESVRSSASAMGRFVLAAVALSPALLGAPRELISEGFSIGTFVFAGYFLQAIALNSSESNKIAFLCSLAVVFVPVLNRIFPATDESEKKNAPLLSILLAISGVGLLELSSTSGPTLGDLWGLLQAAAFAYGFIRNERVMTKFPKGAIALSAAQVMTVGGLSIVWYCLDSLFLYGNFDLQGITVAASDPLVFGSLLYTGLVTTALAIVMENIALQSVSASELSVLLSTEPFFAAAFSAFFLNESLTTKGVIGGGFIIAACLVGQIPDTFRERLKAKFFPF